MNNFIELFHKNQNLIPIFVLFWAGLELLLHPRKTIESMSEKNKGELVSTILSAIQDQDPWEMEGKIQIQAHFTTEQSSDTKGVINHHTGNCYLLFTFILIF